MFKRKHPAMGREAIWNLCSGTVIRGVLASVAGSKYILRAASVYDSAHPDRWIPADGQIVVDAANEDYVQVL